MKRHLLKIALCAAVAAPGCEKSKDSPSDEASALYHSGKRGVGANILYKLDFKAMQNRVAWFYNWGSSYNASLEQWAVAGKVGYFPMLWSDVSSKTEQDVRSYKAAHPECDYILGFNEPNLTDQANMTPAAAAGRWPKALALARELNMKMVAPAMNYGTLEGYNDPVKWLDEFFAQPGVSINDVDALALHCYMNTPAAVKEFVEKFRKYGKPVWMTEFCAWDGEVSVEQQRSYMCDVLNYFEVDPLIERYAWFKYDGNVSVNPHYALRSTGNSNGDLTDLGKLYFNISMLDKTRFYKPGEEIPAHLYSNTNMSEVVGTAQWVAGVQLRVSTDTSGVLEVMNFALPKWLEYQIAVPGSGSYSFDLRYAASSSAECSVYIGDRQVGKIALPATGGYSTWQTLTYASPVSIDGGNHTVRFVPSKGMVSLNWWKFRKS
jgi:hypothetical protein